MTDGPTYAESGAAIAAIQDPRLRRVLMKATTTCHAALRIQTLTHRAVPPLLGATLVAGIPPGPVAHTVSGGLMLVTTVHAGTAVVTARKAVKLLRSAEAACAEQGEWGGAHLAASMQAAVLHGTAFSRAREMLAHLRAFDYAIRNEDQEGVLREIARGRHLITELLSPATRRATDEAIRQSRAIDNAAEPIERIRVRFGLLLMIGEDDHPEIAELAAELGVDMHELSDRQTQELMDLRGEYPLDVEVVFPGELTEPLVDRMALANRFLAAGLEAMHRHGGSETADGLVRSLAARERVPRSTLLEAYATAMQAVDDPRHQIFESFVQSADFDAAFAVIGHQGPELGRALGDG